MLIQKCIVIAAVSGPQKAILQAEFPDLLFVELPGYEIKYGKNRALTFLKLFFSIPKILIRVNREKAWLKEFAHLEKPDLVISDNRYGLHVQGVFSVFITHQLLIRTPFGPLADRMLQRINYSFIRRFSRCWVPDVKGPGALAGALSNPVKMPAIPVRYIGWLSRFGKGSAKKEPTDLLVLLSGPEPQRTLLEKKILDQVVDYTGRTVIVRGVPGEANVNLRVPPQVAIYNHLPAAELEALVRSAGQIVSRAGYSTIMDLVRLGKKAILIPTPGQTEQEYLGNYLAGKGWAVCIGQKGFSLADALAFARESGIAAGAGEGVASGVEGAGWGEAEGELLKKEITAVLTLINDRKAQS